MSKMTKWVIGLSTLAVIVGGSAIYFQEKAKQEACAELRMKEERFARSLSASNVRFDGTKNIKARVTNNADHRMNGEILFRVLARDCSSADCTVIGRGTYEVPYMTIPSGEARDVIGRMSLLDNLPNLEPQTNLRYSFTVDVDLGGHYSPCW